MENKCGVFVKIQKLAVENWEETIKPNAILKFGVKNHKYATKMEYFKIKPYLKGLKLSLTHQEENVEVTKTVGEFFTTGDIIFLFKDLECKDAFHKESCIKFKRSLHSKNTNFMFAKATAITYEFQQFLGNLLLHDPSEMTAEELEIANDKNVEAIKLDGISVSYLFEKNYNEKNINHKKWYNQLVKISGKKSKKEIVEYIKNSMKKSSLYTLYNVFK